METFELIKVCQPRFHAKKGQLNHLPDKQLRRDYFCISSVEKSNLEQFSTRLNDTRFTVTPSKQMPLSDNWITEARPNDHIDKRKRYFEQQSEMKVASIDAQLMANYEKKQE